MSVINRIYFSINDEQNKQQQYGDLGQNNVIMFRIMWLKMINIDQQSSQIFIRPRRRLSKTRRCHIILLFHNVYF